MGSLKLRSHPAQRNVLCEQVLQPDAKNTGQEQQFAIGNPAPLQFQARHGIPADAPPAQLELHGQRFLRPAIFPASSFYLWANQVESGVRHRWLLLWHQFSPGTPQAKLNSQNGCEQDVQLSRFNLLQIPRADLGALGQLLLRQTLRTPLAPDVRTKNFESHLLFAA